MKKNEPKLTGYAKNLSGPVLRFGKATFSAVLDFLVIFILVILLLLEAPKVRVGLMAMLPAERALRLSRISGEVTRSITGYMLGDFITSIIAGVIVFVTLTILGVPYAFLLGLWVALVDFLPMIGGAIAGIPTAIIAGLTKGLVAFIVTAVVFVVYQEIENHILNPIIMSRTVRINPLLVLVSVLIGANLGGLLGGFFGGFVAVLLAIPDSGLHTGDRARGLEIDRPGGHTGTTSSRHRSKAAEERACFQPGRRASRDTDVISRTPMPCAQMNAPVLG